MNRLIAFLISLQLAAPAWAAGDPMPTKKQALELKLQELKIEKELLELGIAARKDRLDTLDEKQGLTYSFIGEVSEDSVKRAMDTIRPWSTLHPQLPLTIVLNSPGGTVTDGMALYDFLRLLPNRKTVMVLGQAMSMGIIITQAGDLRVIGRNAVVMVHEIHGGVSGSYSQIKDEQRCYDIMWDQLLQVLQIRAKKDIRAASERKTVYLTPQEALEWGLVDEIR